MSQRPTLYSVECIKYDRRRVRIQDVHASAQRPRPISPACAASGSNASSSSSWPPPRPRPRSDDPLSAMSRGITQTTRMLDTDSKPKTRRHLMPVDDSGPTMPPHSNEAEQSVLGTLLLDNAAAQFVCELLAPNDFYAGAHREIFHHIRTLVSAERPADVVTVAESLKAAGKLDYIGGSEYLGVLFQEAHGANVAHHAAIVLERSRQRAIMAAATEIGAAAASPSAPASADLLRGAQERLEELARRDDAAGMLPLDLAAMARSPVPERHFRVGRIMPKGAPGLWTGHGGAGKTQAALHLACCLALQRDFFGESVEGDRVAFVSTEDDAAELHYRLAQQSPPTTSRAASRPSGPTATCRCSRCSPRRPCKS